jgi:hypothetical protein
MSHVRLRYGDRGAVSHGELRGSSDATQPDHGIIVYPPNTRIWSTPLSVAGLPLTTCQDSSDRMPVVLGKAGATHPILPSLPSDVSGLHDSPSYRLR